MNEHDNGITGVLIDEILGNIKTLNKIEDSNLDDILTIYIRAICTNILIATNRRIFPPDLKYVVMDLVRNKLEMDKNTTDDNSKLNTIQSMSEAGRSITYGVSSTIENKLNLLAKQQIEDNQRLISKYKLLYRT